MKTNILLLTLLISLSTQSIVNAHNGRRFEIKIDNGQLVTQGYLSGGGAADDGGGLVRPYYNALHDHWENIGPVAVSTLPGFDLHSPAGLMGYDLTLALTGAGKWGDPMNNPLTGSPIFSPLEPSETIYVGFGTEPSIDTDTLGSFLLTDNIAGPVTDIDLEYSIYINPDNALYYLEWELSTDAPGVTSSDPIYTILSPAGMHHPSLMLESYFGIQAVPEPNAAVLLGLASIGMITKRRRR